MKPLFRFLLAVTTAFALALAASAGLFVPDRSDGEYRDAAGLILDKSRKVLWTEDGFAANWTFSVNANSVEYKAHRIESLPSGWYEAVLCDLGTTAEMFPADVSGRIAFTLRGDSSFTVKSENAQKAGAVACIVGNYCPAEEAVDARGVVTAGAYQLTAMTVERKTLPMCMVSSDVSVRLLARMTGVSVADAVDAAAGVRDGKSALGLAAKTSAWLFLGTEEEYRTNAVRTDANTVTGDGVVLAPAVDEEEEIDLGVTEQKYPTTTPLADPGRGYATPEEAADAIGKTPISGYTFLDGTHGNGGEGPENLWDGMTETKFCTDRFPAVSVAALDGEYAIDGILLATANDNAAYNHRSPYEWAVYGSNDGTSWTALAHGDDSFFEETDFTYYAAPLTAEGTYRYVQFQAAGAWSGVFQVSELVLCGTKVKEAETPVAEETVAEEEPAVEEKLVADAPVTEESVEEEPKENGTSTLIFGVLAMIIVLVSVIGYALAKKN